MNSAELSAAFVGEQPKNSKREAKKLAKQQAKQAKKALKTPADTVTKRSAKPSASKKRKLITGIMVFILGLAALAGGMVFLVLNLTREPGLRDAEYLVKVGAWTMEGDPSVVWQFTEVGKGTLTTNAHTNDYDFIWALNGDNLAVETEWLYTLNNEYTYKIDQSASTLTLTSGEDVYIFTPLAQSQGE